MLQSLSAQCVIDNLPNFAIALSDQPHHSNLSRVVLGEAAEQHALADSASTEDPHALTLSDREQSIDHAHAGFEPLRDMAALERIGRRRLQRILLRGFDWGQSIHRTPGSI